jgi:MOSC domain-containing protein YiiM
MEEGIVISVNLSKKKGISKKPVEKIFLKKDLGVAGDAHGGPGDRQVSLLALESIERQKNCPKVRKKAASLLQPGDFAENITTQGLKLSSLKIGTYLKIGPQVILQITKIGKECYRYCSIYYKLGDCIMPREGVFARVIEEGEVKKNDQIKIIIEPITRGK